MYVCPLHSARVTSQDCVISQNGVHSNSNQMLETRRYVALVPYRQVAIGSTPLWSAARNAAVLLFWLGGATLFAGVRIGIRAAMSARKNSEGAGRSAATYDDDVFFRCLAAVLGNNAGERRRLVWHGESLVAFVMGVFAQLTVMLFTGALFERSIGSDGPRQIDTMAELVASDMLVRMCWGDGSEFLR